MRSVSISAQTTKTAITAPAICRYPAGFEKYSAFLRVSCHSQRRIASLAVWMQKTPKVVAAAALTARFGFIRRFRKNRNRAVPVQAASSVLQSVTAT